MPIRAIIEQQYGSVFEPEDIPHLVSAYEAALRKLRLVDRSDPMTLTVAKLIIGLAQQGERDPDKLCNRAVMVLGKSSNR